MKSDKDLREKLIAVLSDRPCDFTEDEGAEDETPPVEMQTHFTIEQRGVLFVLCRYAVFPHKAC